MHISRKLIVCCTIAFLLLIASHNPTHAGVGEAAVVTLSFPPGARATGLGEAFNAVADDANATFFNPAGLGQPPLANAWRFHLENKGYTFTSIAAKRKKVFEMRESIWAGTNRGLLRYNGKTWDSYEHYIVEKDDDLEIIARKYLEVNDAKVIQNAVRQIKRENKIEMVRSKDITTLLSMQFTDSASRAQINDITERILSIPSSDRSAIRIYGIIADRFEKKPTPSMSTTPLIDTATPPPDTGSADSAFASTDSAITVDSLPVAHSKTDSTPSATPAGFSDTSRINTTVRQIMTILASKDLELIDLVDIKIPFTIAVNDSVTSVAVDDAEQVWVGTPHGLWRYAGSSWKQFTILDGLPSGNITSIAIGTQGRVLIGTDKGVGLLADGIWKIYDSENGLPDSMVNAVAFGRDSTLYVGTAHGLAVRKSAQWVMLDTTQGLLSHEVSGLMYDSQDKLWIGGQNGITVYDEVSWKRYKFPESHVYAFAEYQPGKVWIATNKGAISYQAGPVKIDNSGKQVQGAPEWKVYHSKNALHGNHIAGLTVSGRDIWLVSDVAINHYDNAERQVMLFWEPLLPMVGIKDLWHTYFAFVWPVEDFGTFAPNINFINMGFNELTDELGKVFTTVRSWELVVGLAYGFSLKEDLSLGMNIKYVHSALAPGLAGAGNDAGTGRTFAGDAAILQRNFLLKGLDLGFNLQNMGPPIFYINENESDPIPFTLRLGLAYRAIQNPVSDLKFLLDFNREVVSRDPKTFKPDPFWVAIGRDLFTRIDSADTWSAKVQEVNVSAGVEYWYVNFIAPRLGFLFDYMGERYELTFGLGLKYGNLNVDWSYIHSPEGFLKGPLQSLNKIKEGATGVRHQQWRLSLITRF